MCLCFVYKFRLERKWYGTEYDVEFNTFLQVTMDGIRNYCVI